MPDPQPTIELGQLETPAALQHAPNNLISAEIEPYSALPPELHGISYVDDVWSRIKTHPLRNPVLFRNKLDEDPESREELLSNLVYERVIEEGGVPWEKDRW